MVNAPPSQPKPRLFPVPPAAVARHPDLLIQPRPLKAWLDTLPLANPSKAARLLLQQLRLLSRDPQPGSKFSALLRLYEPPIDTLYALVNERIQLNPDCVLPLDQLEHEMQEVLAELAHGYLRLANERLIAGKMPQTDLLYRAACRLDQALGIEQLHYHKPNERNWRSLLAIFLHAAQHDIARVQSERDLRLPGEPGTIHELFYRSLLTSCSDPHHHRPSQVVAWREWIGQHASCVDLAMLPKGRASLPLDISGRFPPLTAARRCKPGPDIRYVVADPLIDRLQQDPEAPPGLIDALDALVRGRRTPEQRQNARQVRDHPYRVLQGLAPIHQRLSQLMQIGGADVTPHFLVCRQTNQSKRGSAFRLSSRLNPPMVIGEPVLAEAQNDNPKAPPVGFVARVQRLLVDDDAGQIEIGVEKLVGRILPIEITGRATERARGDTLALLQHTIDSDRYILIATQGIYREGALIDIEGPGVRYEIRLGRLLGATQRVAFIEAEPSGD